MSKGRGLQDGDQRDLHEPEPLPKAPFRIEPYTNFTVMGVELKDALGVVYWAIRSTGADAELEEEGCRWQAYNYSARGFTEFNVAAYDVGQEGMLLVSVRCCQGDRMAFRHVYQSMLDNVRRNGYTVVTSSPGCDIQTRTTDKLNPLPATYRRDALDSQWISQAKALESMPTNIPRLSAHLVDVDAELTEGQNASSSSDEQSVSAAPPEVEHTRSPETAFRTHLVLRAPSDTASSGDADLALAPLLAMVAGRCLEGQREGTRALYSLSADRSGQEALATEVVVAGLARVMEENRSVREALHACAFAIFSLASVSELPLGRSLIARTGLCPRLFRIAASADVIFNHCIAHTEVRRQCARILANLVLSEIEAVAECFRELKEEDVIRWVSEAPQIEDERLRAYALRIRSALHV